jgi:TPP-dependent trihydroxycyclohexane-1,2-dione (THcHDO) dehydratase
MAAKRKKSKSAKPATKNGGNSLENRVAVKGLVGVALAHSNPLSPYFIVPGGKFSAGQQDPVTQQTY